MSHIRNGSSHIGLTWKEGAGYFERHPENLETLPCTRETALPCARDYITEAGLIIFNQRPLHRVLPKIQDPWFRRPVNRRGDKSLVEVSKRMVHLFDIFVKWFRQEKGTDDFALIVLFELELWQMFLLSISSWYNSSSNHSLTWDLVLHGLK